MPKRKPKKRPQKQERAAFTGHIHHETREVLSALSQRLCADFGELEASAIIQAIVEELGGRRVTLPDPREWSHHARDRRICARFKGDNYEALADNFGLTVRQVRNIIGKQDGRR